MAGFDPAAWVREYEAIGGKVHIVRQPDGEPWLGRRLPRDAEGRGNELDLYLGADKARWRALFDYVLTERGVLGEGRT